MKEVTIKGQYENAKKIAIAFWAQRIADGLLTKEYEENVVKYKAMLMTDIVTLNKQGRFTGVSYLQDLCFKLKEYIKERKDLKKEIEKYIAERADLTCVKRKRKTIADKLKEFIAKLGITNEEAINILNNTDNNE